MSLSKGICALEILSVSSLVLSELTVIDENFEFIISFGTCILARMQVFVVRAVVKP